VTRPEDNTGTWEPVLYWEGLDSYYALGVTVLGGLWDVTGACCRRFEMVVQS